MLQIETYMRKLKFLLDISSLVREDIDHNPIKGKYENQNSYVSVSRLYKEINYIKKRIYSQRFCTVVLCTNTCQM